MSSLSAIQTKKNQKTHFKNALQNIGLFPLPPEEVNAEQFKLLMLGALLYANDHYTADISKVKLPIKYMKFNFWTESRPINYFSVLINNMNWSDEGFLLSKNRYNENSLIVEIFTKEKCKKTNNPS